MFSFTLISDTGADKTPLASAKTALDPVPAKLLNVAAPVVLNLTISVPLLLKT